MATVYLNPKGKAWTLAKAKENYVKYCREEELYTEGTITNYISDIDLLYQFLEGTFSRPANKLLVREVITERYLNAFIDYLIYYRENAPSTVNRRLSALRNFVRFLYRETVIPHSFDMNLQAGPRAYSDSSPRAFSREEEQALVEALHTVVADPRRDYAIFMLFLHCHLTSGEVVRLQVDDVDLRTARIRVTSTNGTQRILPLPMEVHRALAAYLAHRPRTNTRALFLNRWHRPITKGTINHAVRRLRSVRKLREMDITPRLIRKAGIAKSIHSGWSPHKLQKHLNVKSKSTVMRYFEMLHSDGGPLIEGGEHLT